MDFTDGSLLDYFPLQRSLRKLSSYCTLTKWRRPPIRGTHWPASWRMSFFRSSATSSPAPCSAINVFVAPRTASSQTITTIRCYPRLWSGSSSTLTKAIDATLESPVNIPPCPSCPSPWLMELSQISAMTSSYAGAKGLMDHTTMSSVIR